MRHKTGIFAGGLALFLAATALAEPAAAASPDQLNLYTSRHYQTDEALYEDFTKATGIAINRIEGKGNALLERLKSEGMNSPADVFITVNAGMLWRAEQAGIWQPVASALLNERIPENLRHPDGLWFGFSTRARLIFYNKASVQPGEIKDYEDLADPKWKDRICIRTSANIYNQSLMSSMIKALGQPAAEAWAKGLVANFARDPQGGDTDQIRAAASGECDVAVANSYYYVRLLTSKKEQDRETAAKVGVIFPNQDNRGTHVNISGAGLLKNAPHKAAGIAFLEYLASDQAQRFFADGNNEYPVVAGLEPNDALKSLGDFRADPVSVAAYGENQPLAQRSMDRAGWK